CRGDRPWPARRPALAARPARTPTCRRPFGPTGSTRDAFARRRARHATRATAPHARRSSPGLRQRRDRAQDGFVRGGGGPAAIDRHEARWLAGREVAEGFTHARVERGFTAADAVGFAP